MTRTIIRRRDVPEAMPSASKEFEEPLEPDSYKVKLLKFIPAEVISLYVTLESMIRASAQPTSQVATAFWFIFFIGLIATPLYLWRISKVTRGIQLVISTGAFAVWVVALGGPFETLTWVKEHQLIVACVLPIYTFMIPLVYE